MRLAPTGLFLAAAVSPFKRLESEVIPQYLKLGLKVRAGADFVIPQLGYDSRKWDELLRWMRLHDVRRPVLANVYVLTRTVARLFNANAIPGCVVSDELLAIVREGGRRSGQGACLPPRAGGHGRSRSPRPSASGGRTWAATSPPADVGRILEMAEAFGAGLARARGEGPAPRRRGPYFVYTPRTLERPRHRRARAALTPGPLTAAARARARRRGSLAYRLNRLTPRLAFTPGTPGYRRRTRFYEAWSATT